MILTRELLMVYTLPEWLALPCAEMATIVRRSSLTMKIAVDGSTRHYLLNNSLESGADLDTEAYFQHGLLSLLRLIEKVFSCGIESLVLLSVWPPDLIRRDDHMQRVVEGSVRLLLSENALRTFTTLGLQVGLYGNYDVAAAFDGVRPALIELRERLALATGQQTCKLWWGYSAGSGLEEVIARSVQFYQETGRLPTEEELRQACFPLGPASVDIFIGTGWLRIGNIDLPPVLNQGQTDVYSLCHLPLDLTENELRRILYDHLFVRHVLAPTTNIVYTPAMLDPLRDYYTEHSECVIGLGHLVANGFWYPDHLHTG